MMKKQEGVNWKKEVTGEIQHCLLLLSISDGNIIIEMYEWRPPYDSKMPPADHYMSISFKPVKLVSLVKTYCCKKLFILSVS